jgi:hypothetical protein
MTWSYSLSDLASLGKDTVRWFTGDTDINYPQLQDEEISFALTLRGNAYGAASLCAMALSAKYSRLVNMSADGVSTQDAQKAKAYADLSAEYAQKEAIHYALPYCGGISVSDMYANLANSDRVPDIFRFGMFDNPPNLGVRPPNAVGAGGDAQDLPPFGY